MRTVVDTCSREEIVGRIFRTRKANRQRLAAVNAELDSIAVLLKKAATQLECLLGDERNELKSVLSQLDCDRLLQLLANREALNREIQTANEELTRLGALA